MPVKFVKMDGIFLKAAFYERSLILTDFYSFSFAYSYSALKLQ